MTNMQSMDMYSIAIGFEPMAELGFVMQDFNYSNDFIAEFWGTTRE